MWWLIAGSVAMFFASLLAVPAIIVRLPADYFAYRHRHCTRPENVSPIAYFAWRLTKNSAGAVLVMIGIAMLLLPGQGLLSILIGLSLLNFPGKYKIEQRLISRRPVLNAMNWMRARAGSVPLIVASKEGTDAL
ncbi:putative transmembrane protein (PGPGW) [Novipirellula artificiosorum]|uniref:Putative transmembrane protein (PGPGW) n=2 Tax=Novipirellula artificiosorum TaxID=2528016 RepID=A0A5C6CZD7_9BACT|nr:putative transmembrane protein (PGPGW) [Novipirellula artificiosorum]